MFYAEIHSDPDFADIFNHLKKLSEASRYLMDAKNELDLMIHRILHILGGRYEAPVWQLYAKTIELDRITLELKMTLETLEKVRETAYNPYPRKEQ